MTTTPDADDSTDNAAPDVVIREIIRCASSWAPEARLLGNVRAGDIVSALTHTISRAEPIGFEAAIKQLGEPDVATGHWSLDEGNLRWFVGQLKAKPAMTDAELEREAVKLSSSVRVGRDLTDEIMALAKKYRGL